MLQGIKQFYRETLRALDGEIGHVKDFYFDDQKWAVRYVVVDTGSWLSWLSTRLVLISPYAFGNPYQDGKVLLVNLTRKQIENGPSIETHKRVSRRYEEECYQYYGWPPYWKKEAMWGMSDFPDLRSTQAMSGYHVQAIDGTIGHVSDFILDDKSWAIRRLVVEPDHWFSGKEVLISLSKIDGISYDESKVFVNLTKESGNVLFVD